MLCKHEHLNSSPRTHVEIQALVLQASIPMELETDRPLGLASQQHRLIGELQVPLRGIVSAQEMPIPWITTYS